MRLFLHQLRDEVSPHSGRDRKLALGKRRETNNLVEPLQQPADGRELTWFAAFCSDFATVRSALNGAVVLYALATQSVNSRRKRFSV